jgi:mannose-6-phosphate isomerase-like protein (cupin superfamily)
VLRWRHLHVSPFQTKALPDLPDVTAPDGSDVRLLVSSGSGSMAHFSLAPGAISTAVCHRTVEELWFVTAGDGQMWRSAEGVEDIIDLAPGISLSIPVGTSFQFRAGRTPLEAVAVTMPPWPGMDEAYVVDGLWTTQG